MGIFDWFKGKKENSNNSVSRVNGNDTEDVGIITHYKGKPFTGICFGLYDNGNLKEEHEMLDGLKHGKAVAYYENGQLEGEGSFRNDKIEGLWKFYHENGLSHNEGNFKEGEKDGTWRIYNENGQLESEGSFRNDKREGLWKTYRLYGSIKFALTSNISNNKIKEWYDEFDDNNDLYIGLNPMDY
jgi:antitoxin component YwqK of YwqJK toxin-antitoxin module